VAQNVLKRMSVERRRKRNKNRLTTIAFGTSYIIKVSSHFLRR